MKHETKIATVENIVTAVCFGVGALLIVLALYTLMAVKSVSAELPFAFSIQVAPTSFAGTSSRGSEPGTFPVAIMDGLEKPRAIGLSDGLSSRVVE
jgi:hypothetical protein